MVKRVEIIVLIVGIAFVVLLAYFIRLLCTANRTLNTINHILDTADFGHELHHLLGHANDISADIQTKMKSVDPFFRLLSCTGEELELRTALKTISKLKVSQEPEENQKVDCIEWALLGLHLLKK